MPRRRSRSTSPFLGILISLVALAAVAILAITLFVDPNSFKPRIADAVRAATGRELTLKGPISLGLSLQPTLQLSDVSFSNPPGFSRPQMATLAKAEVQLGLWPLLSGHVEIIRLDLQEPDLSLETNASGQTNWKMGPVQAVAPASSSAPVAASATPANTPRFEIGTVRIKGGKVDWINAATGVVRTVGIQDFVAQTKSPNGPISATANLMLANHKIAATAELGSLDRLLTSVAGAAPWPIQLVARVEGIRLAAAGSIDRPLDGRGYQVTLDGNVPDLKAAGAITGQNLPALRDVTLSAKVSDASGQPVPTSILVHVGASDLAEFAPGLSLDHLDVTAAALDQPIQAAVEGALAGTKLRLDGRLGSVNTLEAGLLGTPPGTPAGTYPWPAFAVDVTGEAAGAKLAAKGSIADPLGNHGLDVTVAARIPDLAALSSLLRQRLPALTNIAFGSRVTDGDGGFGKSVMLHGLSLTGPDGDVAGDITLAWKPRLGVSGALAGKRLDLDALQAAYAKAPTFVAPPFVEASKSAAPPAVPAPPPGPKRLFSDKAFDLSVISAEDADLKLAMGEIRSGGISYRDLSEHVVLDHGKLTIDPFSATLPGGKLDLRLMLDTTVLPARISLALHAPGLALKPLLVALRQPDDVTGTVELMADLTAEGNSEHQLASTLAGKMGVVMQDGELDNILLGQTAGLVLKATNVPGELFGGGGGVGRTRIKCVAMRIDAAKGQANVNALVFDTARALVHGSGVINLEAETLGLRIRPMLRTGGPGIVIPVQVTGPIERPSAMVDRNGALQGAATGLASGLLGGLGGLAKNPAAVLSSALAGERGGDACGPAISAARAARPALKP